MDTLLAVLMMDKLRAIVFMQTISSMSRKVPGSCCVIALRMIALRMIALRMIALRMIALSQCRIMDHVVA